MTKAVYVYTTEGKRRRVVPQPDHPAKFSKPIMEKIVEVAKGRLRRGAKVLDFQAGVGRIHDLGALMGWDTTGVEIEAPWAACRPDGTYVGDSTDLPLGWAGQFDGAVWSPTYGTRMGDHHDAQEKCKPCAGTGIDPVDCARLCEKCEGKGHRTYKRNTYKHTLDQRGADGKVKDLTPNNTGQTQYTGSSVAPTSPYAILNQAMYYELHRVTRPGAYAILNVSNHIRKHVEVDVIGPHLEWLAAAGFEEQERHPITTQRLGEGENRDARAEHEYVILLRRDRRKPQPKKTLEEVTTEMLDRAA